MWWAYGIVTVLHLGLAQVVHSASPFPDQVACQKFATSWRQGELDFAKKNHPEVTDLKVFVFCQKIDPVVAPPGDPA